MDGHHETFELFSPSRPRRRSVGDADSGFPDAAFPQEGRDGFYAGLQLGVAFPTAVQSARRYVSHPTRCDVLLYPPSVSPPVDDPACSDNMPRVVSNEFDPGAGPVGGFMVGYATGRVRFEVEYLNASLGSAESPIGTSTVLQTKTSEWSTEHPPSEWMGEYKIHQVFANVYYDFLNDSRWTPFAGAGLGLGRSGTQLLPAVSP